MTSRDTDATTDAAARERATATTGPAATAADAPVTISYEEIDGARIAVVSLNRPAKLNGLTMAMLRGLDDAAKSLRRDRDLRGVIFAGAGDSFCAGLDFGSVLKNPMDIVKAFAPNPLAGDGANLFQRVCWEWRRLPAPVIAVVHGHCYGGGVQLALGADFRVTAADARWSILEAKWGLIPDMSGVQALSELVGIETAKRLTMTARIMPGTEAHGLGLVGEIAADPVAAAHDLAHELSTRSPDQLAAAKRLFGDTWHASPRRTFARERWEQVFLLAAANTKAAREAATKKVTPVFAPRSRRF